MLAAVLFILTLVPGITHTCLIYCFDYSLAGGGGGEGDLRLAFLEHELVVFSASSVHVPSKLAQNSRTFPLACHQNGNCKPQHPRRFMPFQVFMASSWMLVHFICTCLPHMREMYFILGSSGTSTISNNEIGRMCVSHVFNLPSHPGCSTRNMFRRGHCLLLFV